MGSTRPSCSSRRASSSAPRGRGFSLWTRGGLPEDRDLVEVAREEGLHPFFEMPEMVMESRAEETSLPDGRGASPAR